MFDATRLASSIVICLASTASSSVERHMLQQNRLRPARCSRRKISRRAMGEEGGVSFNLASPACALARQRSNRSGGWTQTTTSGIALLLGLFRRVGARAFTAWWASLHEANGVVGSFE
jgi:hypothetical protein